ncbi:AAA-like domain-containing protein [Crocosphaera chwakensis]|uniref:WD-40 repeat n=1 Tax=Crocosphaera chwakensis CCY0110 TaxID=391612 RepID=A3IXZ8_9CHRO|nr:AAA-like domain-containing protein [Crocosphaera chwakensis]EAZ88667.1 WD-40 repeat [Crocosphaera chwakensis CCY0110]
MKTDLNQTDSSYEYQVGGSLRVNAPSYVVRHADKQLYQALLKGEFSYVLNTRQMGKSSLRVRIKNRLQQEGYRCASLDLTSIGSETTTPIQWYKGVIWELWRGFNLIGKVNLKAWWGEQADFSPIQRLDHFIQDILLTSIPSQPIVIFIDEIDSVLGLPFAVDDFWAFIRFCYNQRAENKEYNRLTFALFGVATPSELIQSKERTPFNVGTAIELRGFQPHEIKPLIGGLKESLSYPQGILQEILYWTGGQPFLTQKLCQMVLRETPPFLTPATVPQWIERIVRSQIIDHWETQDEPEHLRTIRDRLLRKETNIARILAHYLEILQSGQMPLDNSFEQRELLLSGLVEKRGSSLRVRNPIYEMVFNRDWVNEQLDRLRPYSSSLQAWVKSQYQDDSRLLRGQALAEAKNWAKDHRLSDLDYQFLAASETCDRRESQQKLEAERLKETEKRLKAQKRLIGVISIALLVSCGLIWMTVSQYRQATLNEIRAIARSSQGYLIAERGLDALIEAIKAKRKLQRLRINDKETEQEVERALGKAVYGSLQFNRFTGHKDGVWGVDISGDGQMLVTASWDHTLKLWERDGKLLKTLTDHENRVYKGKFSHNGQLIASASVDQTIKLWTIEGQLLRSLLTYKPVYDVAFSPDDQTLIAATGHDIQIWTVEGKLLNKLKGHSAEVYDVEFSHNGQFFLSSSKDHTIKLWTKDGQLLKTFQDHNHTVWEVEWSENDSYFLSASEDGTIKQWTLDGNLIKTIFAHSGAVMDIEFVPKRKVFFSAGEDQTIKLWTVEGELIDSFSSHRDGVLDLAVAPHNTFWASASWDKTVKLWKPNKPLWIDFLEHQAEIRGVAFSPDQTHVVTASRDHTLKLWRPEEESIMLLRDHTDGVSTVVYSPDGQFFASGSRDETVRLWSNQGENFRTLKGHTDWVLTVAISPDSQFIASGGLDRTIKLWRKDGTLIKTITGHSRGVLSVDFSPDGQYLVSGGRDQTIKIWRLDGSLVKTIKGHEGPVESVAISPDGSKIVSGSRDTTLKLWNWQGELLQSFETHQERVWTVAFSPNGEMIASGSDDKTVRFWDLEGQLIKTLYGYNSMIRSIAFSPNSEQLAVGSRENMLILWDLKEVLALDELRYGCDWIKDYLKFNADLSESDRRICDGINQ